MESSKRSRSSTQSPRCHCFALLKQESKAPVVEAVGLNRGPGPMFQVVKANTYSHNLDSNSI